MTAVPGAPAPRRLPLSGPFAALAFIAVGLRLMGTLRVRTWQLCGAKTADHRCFIIRTPPPQFQIVIFPRFVGNSDVFLSFCKTRAGPPVAVQSTESNADNAAQIRRKPADFSRGISSCMRSRAAGIGNDVFVTPPPAITGRGRCAGAALPARARASFAQKQSPARAAGLFTCELRR